MEHTADGTPNDHTETVRALLANAGVHPAPEELAAIAATYPMLRQMIASLYAVDAARYEAPAVRFHPEVDDADWLDGTG